MILNQPCRDVSVIFGVFMLEQAQRVLKDIFGYDSFRGRQGAIIERVASGGDALVLMPTGGGKSLCFQVPARSGARRRRRSYQSQGHLGARPLCAHATQTL